jgi:hypothetical protein
LSAKGGHSQPLPVGQHVIVAEALVMVKFAEPVPGVHIVELLL